MVICLRLQFWLKTHQVVPRAVELVKNPPATLNVALHVYVEYGNPRLELREDVR